MLPAGFVPEWIEAEADRLPDRIPAGCLTLIWDTRQPIAFALTGRETTGSALADWARGGPTTPAGLIALERKIPAGEPVGQRLDPTTRPTVSVVIATCRGGESLARLIESLVEQSAWLDQLIMVPNGCDADLVRAGVAETINRVSAPGRHLDWLVTPSDPGLSRARNEGLRHACGELCAVADDDIAIDAHWARAVAAAAVNHPEADLITTLVIATPPRTTTAAWFEIAGGFGKGFDPRIFDGRRLTPAEALSQVGQIGTGAAMVLRTRKIRALGGYCELLGAGTPGIGGEDLNLVLDVLAAGGRVAYEPAIVVRHPPPETREAINRQTFRYGIGLAALVTHRVVVGRLPVSDLFRLAGLALTVIASRSGYAQRTFARFPIRLRALEICGLSLGPLAYVRSLAARRRTSKTRIAR